MSNNDISELVKKYNYTLPFQLYAIISSSEQIDHIVRDECYINMWAEDGSFWRIQVVEN